MKSFLKVDSGFYGALSLIADVVIINLLLVASLLSVIGGGAGFTAAYGCVHTRLRGDSPPLMAQFWAEFRRSFRSSLPVWLVIVGCSVIAFGELAYLAGIPTSLWTQAARALVIVSYLLVVAIGCWYFIALSQRTPARILPAIMQAIQSTLVYLPRTALVVLVVVVPVIVAAISLPWLLRLVGFYLVLGLGMSVYLQALAVHGVAVANPYGEDLD